MCFFVWKTILVVSIFFDSYFTLGEKAHTERSTNIGNQSARVYNGTPVNPPHSRPYIAQLEKFERGIRWAECGTIINEWMLIAERGGIESITKVFAGKYHLNTPEDSQQERQVCFHSPHPDYGSGSSTVSYDYAIVHLTKALDFNEFVKPALFPKYKSDYPQQNCKISGWGKTTPWGGIEPSLVLREGPISILPPSTCPHQHPTIMCLSASACEYDMSAPIMCPDESGVELVIGFVAAFYGGCTITLGAVMSEVEPEWLEQVTAEGMKRCRGMDCCKDDGKLHGNPVIPHSRPYVVQIHYKRSKEVATGVLINAYTILTSAHKLDKIVLITAGKHLFGKYEGTQQTRRPCSVSKHQNVDKPKNAYGFGLIHLSDRFVLNEYVNAISIAPKGKLPNDKCSIIGWQGSSPETVLREQLVEFKDPTKCKSPHETVTCVKVGACLHDWGSPVICTYDSKIYLQAIVGSAKAYCENEILASIPDLPRDWLAAELKKAETTCGKSTL